MKLRSIKNDESGIVSIVVTMFLMLIMTLIVLAMSENANKEQRQTLDRQLSDQAFYNAETGINDTAAYLYANPNAPLDNLTSDCQSLGVGAPSRDIDGASGVNKVTCIFYDKAPRILNYDSVSTSNPKVIAIQGANNAGTEEKLSRLTIEWDDSATPSASVNSPCSFTGAAPSLPKDCSYGGVRIDLIRPAETRDNIRQRSFIAFLLPNSAGAGSVNYSNDQGGIVIGSCPAYNPATRRCKVVINDLSEPYYFLTLRSLYRPTNISISATSSNGSAIRFKNVQTMIDSTGRANDVLRRIQVRIPASSSSQYDLPGFALQSKDSICKVLTVRMSSGVGRADNDDTTNCPIN